ncbi:MAG: two-component regulator propeller domain-containing protein [Bacteroidota bacterium]
MKKILFLLLALAYLIPEKTEAQIHFVNYSDPNEINAFAEDGNFVWIGTRGGLYKRHKTGTLVGFYNTSNGLISNNVQCIAVDNQGVKWIGTDNGISRFDDINWTSYSNDNSGLPENFIRTIAIDIFGNKWIGTFYSGLVKYNDTTWSVFNTSNSGILENIVTTVCIDGMNRKWIGCGSGISILAGNTWSTIDSALNAPLGNVLKIAISPSGEKWIASYNKGVYRFDDFTWTKYTFANTGGLLAGNTVFDISIENNNIWVTTLYYGLSVFNGPAWAKFNTGNSGIISNNVRIVMADGQSNKWIGSTSGISKLVGANWVNIVSTDGIPNNSVKATTSDKNDIKWFCTANGLGKYNGLAWAQFNTSDSLPSNDLNCITVDTLDRKWIGTENKGVFIFTDSVYAKYNIGNSGICNNTIQSILAGPDNTLWIGTINGLSRFKNNVWTTFNTGNCALPDNSILSLAIDENGNIWIGTEGGAVCFNGIAGWTVYTPLNSSLPDWVVSGIAVDTLNNKWFSTWNGLGKLDATNTTWQVYNTGNSGLPENTLTAVAVDLFNNVWTGTSTNGITKFNGQAWISYTSSEGLCGNDVTHIYIDREYNKWIGSSTGVSQVFCENPTPRFVSDIACYPDSTHMNNTSLKTDATTRYYWDIYSNNTLDYTTPNVTHQFPSYGLFQVKMAAANDNCISTIVRVDTVSSLPDVSIGISGATTFCEGDSITLTTVIHNYDTIFNYQYLWSNGEYSPSIVVDSPGNYTVTVYSFNCNNVSDTTIHVTVNHPFENENICLVTVDSATNKNLIVWEKTPNKGTAFFNIYKETAANYYVAIGNLAYDQPSEFLDVNSDASVKSDRYKISVVDTCGNESMLSTAHKTMHLTVNLGTGNEHNLIWEKYEGFPYGQFDIWRALPPAGWIKIATIQSNIYTYTDTADIPGSVDYLMVINKGDTCFTDLGKASSGTYTTSVSNMEQYKVIGVEENTGMIGLLVFPNPANDVLNIKGVTSGMLYISDATGRIVIEQMNTGSVNVSHLERGIYFVSVQAEQGRAVRRFVKE